MGLRLSTLTLYFHEVCGCCSGSSATPGHPHTQLHRRLVYFSSVKVDGGSTLRCRSHSYERVGIKTKRQEKCAFSITDNHLLHLADAFIQSDLQLHSGYTFSLVRVFPGNRTHNLLRC